MHNIAIPKIAFRVPDAVTVTPELEIDSGPAGGLIVGQNARGSDFSAVYLGKQAESPFRDVWLDVRGAHAVYVMGKRRSGKSHTLAVIAEGLASNSWISQQSEKQAVVVLDTMNVFLTMSFSANSIRAAGQDRNSEHRNWRLDDESIPVALYHPRGATMPETVVAQELSLKPSDLGAEEWCGLFNADPVADPMGHLMTELWSKVVVEGYQPRNSDIAVAANPQFTIAELIKALDDDVEYDRYHGDTKDALRRRLVAMRRLPLFSDEGLDMRDLFVPGRVTVLLLRSLDHQMRSVMVALITKKAMEMRGETEQYERMLDVHQRRANKHRAADSAIPVSEERAITAYTELVAKGLPRAWVIVDEAHNYIPSRGYSPSRAALKKYVDEGRNLGLSIVVATQQPAGLDPSIQRNADVLFVHALSHRDDIKAAEGMLNADLPGDAMISGRRWSGESKVFEALVRNLPIGYALVSTDRANRIFPVLTRDRITVHGGGAY